ncbi:MAG: DUF2235 domain-containing protein [Paracoccaceae bacterium]
MKRIAIFCDGTWNHADAEYGTNVVALSQATSLTAGQTFQQLIYIPGLGTDSGASWLSRNIDRLGGGAFGWGLDAKIETAYRALAYSYQPGDDIFIFGFSRGAYTARSLAGLIRSCGIPTRNKINMVRDAMDYYRSRDTNSHPNDTKSYAFRLTINPEIATSPEEQDWRRGQGRDPGLLLQIAYLGVWDTVGALGVPGYYRGLAKLFNKQYQFHDADLSRSVRSARHAVAIDERRRTFPPTLWDNLDKLNDGASVENRLYRQLWFPGDHGSVGGGGDIAGLSDNALVWIAEGAEAAGLEFLPGTLDGFRRQIDDFAPLHNRSDPKKGIFDSLTSHGDRDGPKTVENLAPATRHRWKEARPAYRPKTLERIKADLDRD